MLTFRDAANVAEKIYRFNSLFEMHIKTGVAESVFTVVRFNSLFEMPESAYRINATPTDGFQFSI